MKYPVTLFLSSALAACGAPADIERLETGAGQATALIGRGASLSASCSGCHATYGQDIVSLDGIDPGVIAQSLRAYRGDEQGTSVMHRIARGYSDEDIRQIEAFLTRVREN